MKNEKILVRINNLEEIDVYKKRGITHFLFALEDFSIGYPSFNLNTLINVKGNIYLLLNRILDSEDIMKLKGIISKLTNFEGVFFEDIGVYELLKDTDIPLIWDQFHFVINSKSINIWNNLVSSVNLSNELTLEEIKDILSHTTKPVIFTVFGLNMIMYSRRYLLTYFNEYKKLLPNYDGVLTLPDNMQFKVREGKHGTAYFYDTYFNYISIISKLDDNKIKLYYINPVDISAEEMLNILDGEKTNTDERFLYNETIYKLGDKR